MKRLKWLAGCLFILCVILAAGVCLGADLYVDSAASSPVAPYADWGSAATNIPDALAVAVAGDVVMVRPGVYPVDTLELHAVTLQSTDGRDATCIQGDGSQRCIRMMSNAVLNGFTVTGGYSSDGGGIFLQNNGAGTVQSCIISNNHASQNGGGAYMDYGGVFDDCIFAANTSKLGGAVYCYWGGTAQHCTFKDNEAGDKGGAIYSAGGAAVAPALFSNCVIEANLSYGDAGGIYIEMQALLKNSVISNNWARSDAGGLYLWVAPSATADACRFYNNRCGRNGGATYIYQGGNVSNCSFYGNQATNVSSMGGAIAGRVDSKVNNCLFVGNEAFSRGGGVYLDDGMLLEHSTLVSNRSTSGGGAYVNLNGGVVSNCVFQHNDAYSEGGGVYTFHGGRLVNCLIAENTATNTAGIYASGTELVNVTISGNTAVKRYGGAFLSATSRFHNVILYGNTAPEGFLNYYVSGTAVFSNCCMDPVAAGAGNIGVDPQFVDAGRGRYELLSSSPCVDAGDNAWAQGAKDLDGSIRVLVMS